MNKKKNMKGFTLIELLAVIIILGLLMAIAIPSVTKYIDQSRKNTLVSTINNYIGAAVTGMNNGDYKFAVSVYDDDIEYFIPRTCIALEKGGSNPYGTWTEDVTGVVVTYAENQGYSYAFQFADSSHHWMAKTAQQDIDAGEIKQGSGATGSASVVTTGYEVPTTCN